MESAAQPRGRGRMGAMLALALGIAAVVVIWISFRGLLYLTIPLAAAALVVGVFTAARARAGGSYAAAIVAVILGGVVLLLSLLALVVNTMISSDYEVYDQGDRSPPSAIGWS